MAHDSSSLQAFLPRSVIRWVGEEQRTPPFAVRRRGAVMLADIAGFTPLAESLAAQGARGAEELTRLLNVVLGAVADRIARDGGEVIKFAGDALLAVWTDAPLEDAVARAAACGLALHGVTAEAAGRAGVELSLSVGVGAGDFQVMVLAGSAERWEHLPLGDPLTQVAVASRVARAGETVLSGEAWARVSTIAQGDARADGCTALRAIPPPSSEPARAEEVPPPSPERLLPFVSPAVRARLEDTEVDWLNELRRVTVLFLHVDTADDESLEHMQEAFSLLCRAVDRVGGTVDKFTMDEKGPIAVAALGLPPRAHADDPLRALSAALDLRDAMRLRAWRSGVGLATGRVFCGVVGSDRRREYTVIGDTVNLAARLMQHAGDDVLCDEATATAARSGLSFLPPRSLRLKGKADEIRAYIPRATGTSIVPPSDPVRGAELASLRESLDALLDGRGGVVIVDGAAGQGKSQLLSRLLREARSRGLLTLAGAADVIDRGTAYLAWRSVVAELLGIDELGSPESRIAVLRERLGDDAFTRDRIPLLGEVLGLPLPDNELTAGMSGEVRAFNTQDLLVKLLRACAEGPSARPVLIALDDVHWMDSASFGLVREVARKLPAVLLLLFGRPFEGPQSAAVESVLQLEGARRMTLAPLSVEGTAGLLTRLLGAQPDPSMVEAVHARADGNPFFTAELARGLLESDRVDRVDGVARLRASEGVALSLPETVQGAIVARIDRLDPVGQLMIKVTSVIGRSFAWSLLHAIHPVEAHRPLLRARCDDLVGAELTELDAPEPAPAWRYRHEITREVAYELLLFSQRRQLHEGVARALEESPAPSMVRLAFHWEQAERPEKALPCFEAAGDQALREGAYEEALRAFSSAKEIYARHPSALGADAPGPRLAHWEHQRGEALLGLGRLAESREALERAVELLGFDVPRSPLALGRHLLRGVVAQAGRRVPGSRPRALSPVDAARHRKAAQACLRIIETCFFLAGPIETTHAALRALNIAEAAGPSPELARAYALFGWILSMVPLFGVADHYLALADALTMTPEGQPARQPVRFFTGFTRTATGRWEEAREALTEAISLAHELGDKRRWIEAVCGICSPMHYQGEYEARVDLGKGVLYNAARRQGDRQAECWGILDQLESLLPLADVARIAPLLDELEPYLDRPIGRSEKVWANGLLALGRLQQGREELAFLAAVRTNDAASSMDPVAVYVFEGHAGACEVLLRLLSRRWAGRDARGLRRELGRSLRELARYSRVFPYARARLLTCRGRAQALEGSPRAARVLRDAVEEAVRVRMPFEEAIARHALSSVTGDGRERATAAGILERIGASAWPTVGA